MISIVVLALIIAIATHYEENWTYDWTGIRKEIRDSVLIFEAITIKPGTASTAYFSRKDWILINATGAELHKLIEYPNGNVKALAYADLVLKAIKDTTYQVDYQIGREVWVIDIGEYLLESVLMIDDRMPPPPVVPDFGLSDEDKAKILAEYRKRQIQKYGSK